MASIQEAAGNVPQKRRSALTVCQRMTQTFHSIRFPKSSSSDWGPASVESVWEQWTRCQDVQGSGLRWCDGGQCRPAVAAVIRRWLNWSGRLWCLNSAPITPQQQPELSTQSRIHDFMFFFLRFSRLLLSNLVEPMSGVAWASCSSLAGVRSAAAARRLHAVVVTKGCLSYSCLLFGLTPSMKHGKVGKLVSLNPHLPVTCSFLLAR